MNKWRDLDQINFQLNVKKSSIKEMPKIPVSRFIKLF
jgi:hypothetical protein